MKTLTAQTRQWKRAIALTYVLTALSLTATVTALETDMDGVQKYPPHAANKFPKMEQQVRIYEPAIIEFSCRQLIGEDRRYKTDPRPQVECSSSVVGVFFWHLQDRHGNWRNVYYTQQPSNFAGYMFSTDPGEIRIQFMDLDGNTSEYFLTLDADYRPCIQALGCLMV
jgi:hypothetical protein